MIFRSTKNKTNNKYQKYKKTVDETRHRTQVRYYYLRSALYNTI